MPFVRGQPISAPQGPLCASSSTIRPLEGTHAPLLPSPAPNARVFTATPTSPLSLSRFAPDEAPGTDIRVLQEETHVEEVAGWTADLEPTAGPKSLLRGTALGTVGSVGWTRVPRHLGHRRGHWGNSCEPAAPSLRICARGLGWAAEEPSRMDPPQQETSPPGHFRSPCQEESREMCPSLWHRFSRGLREQVGSQVHRQPQIRTRGAGMVRFCHPASQDTIPTLDTPPHSPQCPPL